jgi:hypothetical protein
MNAWNQQPGAQNRTLSWEELEQLRRNGRPQGVTFATDASEADGAATPVDASQAQRVLRNTLMLLAATLGFSALTAGVSLALGLPHPGLLLTLVGYFGLLFLVHKLPI